MLYSIFIHIYALAIRSAATWNRKARSWAEGRKDWKAALVRIRERSAGRQILLLHCASLGEFEQGRPVLEAVRKRYPGCFIVLSFFSPSGYEVRKGYDKADAVIYLPADTKGNARAFVDILSPNLAIFVKYEYWLNLLDQMERKQVPVLMVSAIFREGQVFFRWYGSPWRRILETIDHFFVQDGASAEKLQQLGLTRVTVSGDTRFDRVLEIASGFSPIPEVARFCDQGPVLVAGSTWAADEQIIAAHLSEHPSLRCIIAPHEIHESHLRQVESMFPGTIRFSQWTRQQGGEFRTLIIDNIGMLSRLYHYASVCYIGGGFGKGIHNTLEAAVHGKPIVFGPRFSKFREAVELVRCGGGFSVEDGNRYAEVVDRLLADPELLDRSGKAAGDYVRQQAGATAAILHYIQEKRLLTS